MVLRILEMALDRARAAGASYADARSLRQADEGLTVRNGQVEQASSGMSYGLGVRVLVDGQWGYAAGSVVSEAEAAHLAGLAAEIARASSAARKREVRLAPVPPAVDTWESPCRIDPWSVPTSRKVDLLRETCAQSEGGCTSHHGTWAIRGEDSQAPGAHRADVHYYLGRRARSGGWSRRDAGTIVSRNLQRQRAPGWLRVR